MALGVPMLLFLGNLTNGVLRPLMLTPSMLGGQELLRGSVWVEIRVRGTGYGVWGTGYRDTRYRDTSVVRHRDTMHHGSCGSGGNGIVW
ncbi:hypothetical protein Q3G72_007363 [Acer saccharum]|nr:hypothetical protein Q3G72_007363 [Acer saccharum]